MQKLKQITFTEAIGQLERGQKVFVIDFGLKNPTLKKLENITFGEAIKNKDRYIFQIIEEGSND